MKRPSYSPEFRQQIIASAKDVRANGHGWDEALMVAKQTGYKGGLPGLRKLIRDAESSTAAAPRKRGRPRKTAPVRLVSTYTPFKRFLESNTTTLQMSCFQ